VLQAFDQPAPLLEKFRESARALIRDGADVIIPGEAPLCVLLARNGVNRVDEVPVLDALGATSRWLSPWSTCAAASGIAPARRGYFMDKAAARAVKELLDLTAFRGSPRLPGKA
jgi:hypothetical protein